VSEADESIPFGDLVEIMKHAAGALRGSDVPFLLGGGIAVWAHGGPDTDHDVDFLVREGDAERALESLTKAGLEPERPPEGWLYKAWEDRAFVDLIFETSEGPVTDDYFDRGARLEVYSVRMQVASIEDILVTKLLALSEQKLDYGPVVQVARSLREKTDWDEVRRRTRHSPYATAFFSLLGALRIVEDGVEEAESQPSSNLKGV
jgi:Nucleotidyl transferase of unknown function (DUF2204)